MKIAKVRDAPMVLGGRGRAGGRGPGGFRREFSRETDLRREPSMRSVSPLPPRGPAADRCSKLPGHNFSLAHTLYIALHGFSACAWTTMPLNVHFSCFGLQFCIDAVCQGIGRIRMCPTGLKQLSPF